MQSRITSVVLVFFIISVLSIPIIFCIISEKNWIKQSGLSISGSSSRYSTVYWGRDANGKFFLLRDREFIYREQ